MESFASLLVLSSAFNSEWLRRRMKNGVNGIDAGGPKAHLAKKGVLPLFGVLRRGVQSREAPGRRRPVFQNVKRCGGSLSVCGRAVRSRCAFCKGHDHIPTDTAGWTWAAPPESCQGRAPIAGFHCLRKRGPSAVEGPPAWGPTLPTRPAHAAHRGRGRETTRTLWPFEHPRQPYESWYSIRRGIFQWLVVRFF